MSLRAKAASNNIIVFWCATPHILVEVNQGVTEIYCFHYHCAWPVSRRFSRKFDEFLQRFLQFCLLLVVLISS